MNANSRFLNEAKELETRWGKTGLLEGIQDRYVRSATAVLLENQRLMNEVSTDTGDIAQFKRISIPLVRRIYPQLIANKIVSVQLHCSVQQVWSTTCDLDTAATRGATRGASNIGGFPGDDANSLMQLADGTANLDIFYSSQFVQNEVSSTDAGLGMVTTYAPLEHTPILAGTVTGTLYVGAVAVQTFVVTAGGSVNFVDIGAPAIKGQTAGSMLDLTTGELKIAWNGGTPGVNHAVVSYEYNMECNQDLPEINLVIESEEIAAKTRKLKAVWSYEAQQDLRSQHNLDAEAELTAVLAQEINLEIDREVLTDLRNNSWYCYCLGLQYCPR
jgi:hypothetical protein